MQRHGPSPAIMLSAPIVFAIAGQPDRSIVYLVFGGFLLTLLAVGLVFRHFSKDSSDYFRAGGRATWWLAGGSVFMQGFSAWTFTGAAGAAYTAGWSVVLMFGMGSITAALLSLGPAGWFRNLRVVTQADAIRLRYGSGMEQFYAGLQAIMGPLFGGVQLYTLAIFISALLGFKVPVVIVVLGFVVLFYSALSGAWAVLAADFIQCLILLPAALLITGVCLYEIGGIGGLLERIDASGLTAAYAPLKSAVQVASLPGISAGYFTAGFFVAWLCYSMSHQISLVSAQKFFAVKDSREARRAAWFYFALYSVGMLIWFIPPMTARLLIPDQVAALPLKVPAEGAYAAISMHFLPAGLVGLIMVAMCAATMSTLDGGMTLLSGVITQNVYPAVCRRFGATPVEGRARLVFGRIVTLLCAFVSVSVGLILAAFGSGGAFKTLLDFLALVLTPIAVPMCLGLFLRRLPSWAAPTAIACGFGVSAAIRFGLPALGFTPWFYHEQIFAVVGTSTAVLLLSRFFFGWEAPEVAERETRFFELMKRPVDFASEIGADSTLRQLRIVGTFGLCIGCGILLLLFPASSAGHAGKILAVASGTLSISLAMFLRGGRKPSH